MADEQQTSGIEQALKTFSGAGKPTIEAPPITAQLKNLAQTLVLIEREIIALEKNFNAAVTELRRMIGRVGS